MKAAIFHGPNQPLTIEDVEVDKPQDREVLVKTAHSGVCHSDLHFIDGFYPYPAPALFAFLSGCAEISLPVLLVFGFATRFAAAARVGKARRRPGCKRFEVGELFRRWRAGGGAHGVSRGLGG